MELIYLVLIVAFLFWSGQILVVYRRQVRKVEEQILQARTSQGETLEQAEAYEARAQELTKELDELKGRAGSLEKTEQGLERELMQFRQREASRNPTRHRVEPDVTSE